MAPVSYTHLYLGAGRGNQSMADSLLCVLRAFDGLYPVCPSAAKHIPFDYAEWYTMDVRRGVIFYVNPTGGNRESV